MSESYEILRKGFTQKEHKALDDHYRTPPEKMGECEPGCVLCASDKIKRKHRPR